MKQRKSPAVTSPWKIGLLVSLLIASTGAGVNYLLMRTFNFSWNWVNLEPGNYAFHLDQFLDQMFPQVALVVGICLVAYFTITAAVRRYRAYLDSGLDYRHLIQSIQHIEDLNDEAALKKLSKYPELKCFLGEMRNSLKQRDALIDQQNADLEQRACDEEFQAQVQRDCEALISVISEKIVMGERRELNLDLGSSELQEVAKAILEIPVRRDSACGDEEKTRMAEVHQDLREASDFITARLEDIAGDLVSNSQEAKNIELQINALKQVVDPPGGSGKGNEKIHTLEQISTGVSNMTQLSEALAELSEETKSIAISSALHAGSGEGTLADLILLAEGVKEIAKKYEQSAASYRTVAGDLSGRVSALDKIVRDETASPEAIITSTVNTLSSKMSLWVERIVVLSDKIKTLEKSYRVSFQTLEDRISGYAELTKEEDTSFEIEKSESLQLQSESIETQSSESILFNQSDKEDSSKENSSIVEDMVAAKPPSFHVEQSSSNIPREEAHGEGLDGIVKERNIFENTQDVEDQYFADRSIEIQDQFDKIEPNVDVDAPETVSDRRERVADSNRDLGAVNFESIRSPRELQESLDEPIEHNTDMPGDSSDSMHETEEEIIDLYTLGAVDYVAHHSEQQQ